MQQKITMGAVAESAMKMEISDDEIAASSGEILKKKCQPVSHLNFRLNLGF